jgi:hypothetical protein
MPLLAFWESNPDEVGQTSIEQIVAMAGDGNLRDGSHCSTRMYGFASCVRNSAGRSAQDSVGAKHYDYRAKHLLAYSFSRNSKWFDCPPIAESVATAPTGRISYFARLGSIKLSIRAIADLDPASHLRLVARRAE